MRRLRFCAALLTISMTAVACGGGETATETSASAMPEGVFDTVSGSQIDLGSLEGQDTVLWFWAPW